jgi:hypothetical protein
MNSYDIDKLKKENFGYGQSLALMIGINVNLDQQIFYLTKKIIGPETITKQKIGGAGRPCAGHVSLLDEEVACRSREHKIQL